MNRSTTVRFRDAWLDVVYRINGDDIVWEFAAEELNFMPLRADERRAIRQEVLATTWRNAER